MVMNKIHPLAIVDPSAVLGDGVEIGPFAVVGADVRIGDGCTLMTHSIIEPHVSMGRECTVFPGAVIGAVPQDLKFHGEVSYVEIGDRVTVRECATINRGTAASGKNVTRIGSDNLIMSYVHIAHDCTVGDHCVLVSKVAIAGETELGDWAILGGGALVHQFTRIGAHAMVGGATKVVKDIPPYVMADRSPVSYLGVNRTGLLRRGFTEEQVDVIKAVYDAIYFQGMNTTDALVWAEENLPASPELRTIVDFVRGSSRGVIPPPRLGGVSK